MEHAPKTKYPGRAGSAERAEEEIREGSRLSRQRGPESRVDLLRGDGSDEGKGSAHLAAHVRDLPYY